MMMDAAELSGFGTTYRVESASEAGKHHEVTVAHGRALSCTCRGWQYRRQCRHARIALAKHLDGSQDGGSLAPRPDQDLMRSFAESAVDFSNAPNPPF